jgi:uncharacterized repeat protein (TIGR01451 family)
MRRREFASVHLCIPIFLAVVLTPSAGTWAAPADGALVREAPAPCPSAPDLKAAGTDDTVGSGPSRQEGAPVHAWARTYSGPLHAWYQGAPAYDVVETGDGGYVTTGPINNCENSPYCTYGSVVRYNADGSVAWTRIFGQASVPSTYLTSVVKTDDGSYAATGYTSAGGIGQQDVLVVKVDAAGNVLWQKTYGWADGYDVGQRIYQNGDGTLTVVGYAHDPGFGGYYDGCYWGATAGWVLKLDQSGALLSNRIMGANQYPTAYKTSDGGTLSVISWCATGVCWTTTLQKFAADGSLTWDRSYYAMIGADSATLNNGTATEVPGGFIVAADAYTSASGSHLVFFKVDGSGNVVWATMAKSINAIGSAYPGQVEATADGGALVAVTSGYSTVNTRLVKVSASGTIQWARSMEPSNPTFLRMKPHSAGGYIVGGVRTDQLLARLDTDGTLGPVPCTFLPIVTTTFTPEPGDIRTIAGPGSSICNSHFVGPSSQNVSLLVNQGDYAKSQECVAQFIAVWTPEWAQTGTQPSVAVQYINTTDVTAHDTVVLVDLPLNLSYVSSTGGGIYYPPLHQVFWKLGDVPPVGSGMLSVAVDVPWGEPPHSWTAFLARIAASNIPNASFDRTPYLAYVPVTTASEIYLTPSEIAAELAGDPALRALYDKAVAMGYQFFNAAMRTIGGDGSSTLKLFMLSSPDAVPLQVVSAGGLHYAETFNNDVYTLFDVNGGYSLDRNQGLFLPWGSWAQQGTQTAPAAAGGLEVYNLQQARCQLNCTINSIPEQGLKMLSSEYKLLTYVNTCKTCAASMAAGNPDAIACSKCGVSSMEKFSKTVAKNLPGIGTAYGWTVAIGKCYNDCASDPSKHICTDDKKECTRTILGALSGYDTVVITPCNKTLGIYAPVPNQWIGCLFDNLQKCVPGQGCVNVSSLCNGAPCKQKQMEIRTPHDPNDKLVDVKGDVLPGQLLTYTVEYQNTGDATASGVFVQDALDQDLDESTLVIHDGGIWSAGARQITWNVGDLAPGAGGSVTFSVRARTGLAPGTEIVNAAEVNFPNALEVTPTNAVVNRVSSVAADPQTVAVVSGQAASVTLTGRDTAGGAVTYDVHILPSFGTLTGTVPNLTYVSDYQFSGQDEFFYTVTGASGTSSPARVVINVSANPSDYLPPAVVSTYPSPGATGVLFTTTAVSTNPDQYRPVVSATFNEPMDGSTITASTFTMDGKAGTVSYDETTRTARFAPTTALAAATVYTARLKTGIKDKAGNPLMTEFSWSFTTETPVGMTVSLPYGAPCLTFPSTQATQTSPGQVVTVMSTGTQNLVLGTVSLTGASASDFQITSDQCSGHTLQPGQLCTATVAFAPSAAGPKNADLSLPSNDPESPAVVSLVGTATAPPCLVSCTASVPGSALATAPVSFSGSATLTNCLSPASYAWAFGDGQTSTQQNPSHAYAAAGTYTWTLTVTADSTTCTKTGVITVCALTCSASASVSSGQAPLAVSFTASASAPGGCTVAVTYDWNFGDGSSHSSAQNPTHTYSTAGSFAWSLLVTAGGVTCTKTGTITVSAPCTLTCSATVPAKGSSGLPLAFTGTAAPSNCSGQVAYDWDFGDGTAHATTDTASHTYNAPNTYRWTFNAQAQGVTCTQTGTVTVVAPPVITGMAKLVPFGIKVTGSNLQNGIRVFINGTEWTNVQWKNTGKVKILGGASLKAVVPKGSTRSFRFLNPDGGEATMTWGY